MNKTIMVSKISLESFNKLVALGYTVVIHNPEANKRTPHTNPRLEYDKPKKPTYIPPTRDQHIKIMYQKAFQKGLLK